MSRSIQRSKCTRVGCLACKPHKVTGERPISELRAPSAGDAPSGHWHIGDPYNPEDYDYPCDCTECTAEPPRLPAFAPLTVRPFASLGYAA
jgi:hypothetical protein